MEQLFFVISSSPKKICHEFKLIDGKTLSSSPSFAKIIVIDYKSAFDIPFRILIMVEIKFGLRWMTVCFLFCDFLFVLFSQLNMLEKLLNIYLAAES